MHFSASFTLQCEARCNLYVIIIIRLHFYWLQRPPRRRRPRYNKQTEDNEEGKPANGGEDQVEETQDSELAAEAAESNGQQV